MVLLTQWMIGPSICMVCIQRPQFLISCKFIDICVKYSSCHSNNCWCPASSEPSPEQYYHLHLSHSQSNLIQNVGPNLVETMHVLNDAAEKRIEGELSYFIFSFFCKNNS